MIYVKKELPNMLKIIYCLLLLFMINGCFESKNCAMPYENKTSINKALPIIPYYTSFKSKLGKIKVFYGTVGKGQDISRTKMLVYIDDDCQNKPELVIIDDGSSLIRHKNKKYKTNFNEIIFVKSKIWPPIILSNSWSMTYTTDKKQLQKKIIELLRENGVKH